MNEGLNRRDFLFGASLAGVGAALSSCALCELSDISCRNRGESVDIPDFTRGGWKTAKPLGIESVDISKMGV